MTIKLCVTTKITNIVLLKLIFILLCRIITTHFSTGLGYETALDFAKRGAKVILACRNPQRAEEACQKIIEETDNPNISTKIVDFSSFYSVRAFARELTQTEDRLDILVNNAGIAFADDTKSLDGHDLTMQVNYYSHFLLTHLLIELMRKSGDPSRIVNVSSIIASHCLRFHLDNLDEFRGYMKTYEHSKLCLNMFTKELAKRLETTNITAYSLHPGAIKTEIMRQTKGMVKTLFQLIVALFYKVSWSKRSTFSKFFIL